MRHSPWAEEMHGVAAGQPPLVSAFAGGLTLADTVAAAASATAPDRHT